MSTRGRRSHPTNPSRLLALERERKALILARRGFTIPEIQRELGYKQASGAYRAVIRGLQRAQALAIKEANRLRYMHFIRLEAMFRRLEVRLASGVILLTKDGHPIMDPQTEKPRTRPLTVVEETLVVDRQRKILERGSRLMGLDLQAVAGAFPPEEGEGGLATSPMDGEVLTIEVEGEVAAELHGAPEP